MKRIIKESKRVKLEFWFEREIIPVSLCVDSSTFDKDNWSRGLVDIRVVLHPLGEVKIRERLPDRMINNLGEYIALYKACKYLKDNNIKLPVFGDSLNALSYAKRGKYPEPSINNKSSWVEEGVRRLVLNADRFFKENKFEMYWWDKKRFGENPADFGRK